MPNFYRPGGIGLLLLSLVFSITAFSSDTLAFDSSKDQLVLGVLPFVSPERLERRFAPLADYLSHKLDFDVVIETAPSFRTFIERTTEANRYDLLLTAPHLYYLAQRERIPWRWQLFWLASTWQKAAPHWPTVSHSSKRQPTMPPCFRCTTVGPTPQA
jgi:hypothetical protein